MLSTRTKYTTSQKGEKHKMTNPACTPAEPTLFSDDTSTPRLDQLAATKYVGVIGSRQLPTAYKEKVKQIVELLLAKGYGVASGGAAGADNYALEALLELSAAHRGIIFSPWQEIDQFPIPVRENVKRFIAQGGNVLWGDTPRYAARQTVVAGLLARNRRLIANVVGLVAFPYGESRGTAFTVQNAKDLPVRIFQSE